MANNIVSSFSPGADRNNFTGFVGMKFTPVVPMFVTALGCRMATGDTSSTVNLSNAAGTILATGSVSFSGGSVGTFYYVAVTGVSLTPGTSYFLTASETSGGQLWSDFGAVALNSSAVIAGRASGTVLSSLSVTAGSTSYVGVDLQFVGSGNTGVSVAKGLDAVVLGAPPGVRIAKALDVVVLGAAVGVNVAKALDVVVLENVVPGPGPLRMRRRRADDDDDEYEHRLRLLKRRRQVGGVISRGRTAISIIVG